MDYKSWLHQLSADRDNLELLSAMVADITPTHDVMRKKKKLSREQVADVLSRTLTDHPRLLRLLSMNHFEMEANSRPERLTEFKRSFGASLATVDDLVKAYIPDMDEAARQRFLYAFFPFIYGIYPYTSVTEKQKEAMKEADIPYVYQSAYELTFACVKRLLAV